MDDLKDRLKLSRKERVAKLLKKINSGEYKKEASEDAKKYVSDAYDSLDEEGREKLAEKEKERMKKRFDRENK